MSVIPSTHRFFVNPALTASRVSCHFPVRYNFQIFCNGFQTDLISGSALSERLFALTFSLFRLPCPPLAPNVVAAWRRWRLTIVYAGRKNCKFVLLFERDTPPLAPNRALGAGVSSTRKISRLEYTKNLSC